MPRRRTFVRNERVSPVEIHDSDDSIDEFIDDEDVTDDQSSDSGSDNSNSDFEYTITSEPDRDEVIPPELLNDSGHPASSSNSPNPIILDEEPGPSNRMPGRGRRSTSRGGRGGRTSGATTVMTPTTSASSSTNNEEVPNKKPKLEDDAITVPFNDSPFNNDENNGCAICFDEFAQTGDHRLVTLKCGHIFGKSCIERWVRSDKNCPTCKKTAKLADIIQVFIPSGIFGENTAKTNQMQMQIKNLEQELEHNKKEIEEVLAKNAEALAKKDEEIENLHLLYKVPEPDEKFALRLICPRSFLISNRKSAARSLSFSSEFDCIVTSCDMRNGKPFGIQQHFLNGSTITPFKASAHDKRIRCIQVCPSASHLVASISEDRMLCVFNIRESAQQLPRFTTKLIHDCYNLCWESDSKIVVGLRNGILQRFNIDEKKDPEELWEFSEPITSVAYNSNHRVFFVATVKGVYVYRNSNKPTELAKVSERVSSFYYASDINCFLLTAMDDNTGMKLMLYRVDFGKSWIKAEMIREHFTGIKSTATLTSNLIWTTETGYIACAFYDVTKKVVRIFNWGQLNDPALLSFKPCNEIPHRLTIDNKQDDEPVNQISFISRSAQGPTAPNGKQNILTVLTNSRLYMRFILYTPK